MADGFDLGPLKCDRNELKEQLKKISLNPYIGGGAWGLTLGGPQESTTHGIRERLTCDRKGKGPGTKTCGCLWNIYYEWSDEGWVLERYPYLQNHQKQIDVLDDQGRKTGVSLVVAHALIQPLQVAELRTTATGRQIPPELHELGVTLSKICNPAQIHHGLQNEARRRHLDPNAWSYDDVLRKFPCDASLEKDFDATGLIEELVCLNDSLNLNISLHPNLNRSFNLSHNLGRRLDPSLSLNPNLNPSLNLKTCTVRRNAYSSKASSTLHALGLPDT